jgi:hypothetical protein
VQRRTSKNRNRVEPLNRNAKTLSAIMSLYWLKCGSRRLSDDVEPLTKEEFVPMRERAFRHPCDRNLDAGHFWRWEI